MDINEMIGKVRGVVNGDKAERVQRRVERFTHLWNTALHWVCLNTKKKMSAKSTHRLNCLHELREELYSTVLPSTGMELLHCIELISSAISCKKDAEFLDKISGFTTAEMCSMVGCFNEDIEEGAANIARFCMSSTRFIDFLSTNGIEEREYPEIPEMILGTVKDEGLNKVDMAELNLNNNFASEIREKFQAIKESIQGTLTFNNPEGRVSIDDISLTMVMQSMLGLTCKICAFPMVGDGLVQEETIHSAVNIPNGFTSKEEARQSIDDLLGRDSPDGISGTIIGLLCREFAVNNIMAIGSMGGNMPDRDIVNKIYNNSGLLVHDREEQKLLSADWSEFSVSFYNSVAEFYDELGMVHEDVSEELEGLLSGKKDKNGVVSKMLASKFPITASHEILCDNLPTVALPAEGGEEDTPKRKPRRRKKL